MDGKLKFDQPPNWVDWEEEELISCGDHERNFTVYTNGVLANTQYHPVRLEIVMASVEKINNREITGDFLNLTGPTIMSIVMNYT
jgi:hypothetical protein